MPRSILAALVACSLGPSLALHAQESLVFSVAEHERLLDGAGGNVHGAELRPSELARVLPSANFASAHPFLSDDAQWLYVGDLDADGNFVDDASRGPGGAIDAVFVPRYGAAVGAVGPRDVYVSCKDTFDFSPAARDGDVFRYSTQGSLLRFVNEVDLAAGITGVTDFDLDALAQSDQGDLFFSVSDDVLGAVGTDGSILFVPFASIFYGPGDIVLGVASNSVVEIATEADVAAWIVASGVRSVDGSVPGTANLDLSALELDPNGGTWVSSVDGQSYPNLWFSWDDAGADAAVLTTASGGTLATYLGVPLASTSSTTGAALGLLPRVDGVGGLGGLARLSVNQSPLVLENYPTSRFTPTSLLFTRQEVSGATPGGGVFFFWDNVSNAPGSVAPRLTLPPAFSGQLFGDAVVQINGAAIADPKGNASFTSLLPPLVLGSNLHVTQQAFDLTSATFSTPAPMDF